MKNAFKFVIAGAAAASIGALAAVIIKKITKKVCYEDVCDECDVHCADCDCEVCNPRSRRQILNEDFDVPALREEAKALGIKRVWRMKKADLVDAIVAAEDDTDDDYIEIECSDEDLA